MKWGKNQATLGHFANWIPAEKSSCRSQ